jgi:chromosome segregation ATPase
MSKLRDLLLDRRSEISGKVAPLVSDIARLKEALSKKQSELAAWNAELDQIHSALKAVDETETKSQLTIKQAVIEALKDHPEGMTALEILAEINTRYFGGRIIRSSLSPQLSRLKDDDRKIDLRGNKWFLLPEQPSLFQQIKRRV